MPLMSLLEKNLQPCPTTTMLKGRPGARWRDYISQLAWEHLGLWMDGWCSSHLNNN